MKTCSWCLVKGCVNLNVLIIVCGNLFATLSQHVLCTEVRGQKHGVPERKRCSLWLKTQTPGEKNPEQTKNKKGKVHVPVAPPGNILHLINPALISPSYLVFL